MAKEVTLTPAWSRPMDAFFDYARAKTDPHRSEMAAIEDRAGLATLNQKFTTQLRHAKRVGSGAETFRNGTGDSSDDVVSGDQPGGYSDTLPRHSVAGNHHSPLISCVSFPSFNGDEVDSWISRCEHYFEVNKIAEILKVHIASSHLEGEARHWHLSVWNARNHAASLFWDAYVAAVRLRFGLASENAMSRLRILKQKESVASYLEQFEALLNQVPYPLREAQVVELLLGGLREEVQTLIRKFRPKSLVEVRGLARLQEAINNSKSGQIRSATDTDTLPMPIDPEPSTDAQGQKVITTGDLDEVVTRRWWGETEQVGSVSVKVPQGTVLEGVAKCKGLTWTFGEVPFTAGRYLLPLEGWVMEWEIQGLKKCSLIPRKVTDDEKATVIAQNTEDIGNETTVGAVAQQELEDQPRILISKCDIVPIAGVSLAPVLIVPTHAGGNVVVKVAASKHNNEEQYDWEAEVGGSFNIMRETVDDSLGRGTKITLFLKEKQLDSLERHGLENLVRKNFEFNFRHLIYLWMETTMEREIVTAGQSIGYLIKDATFVGLEATMLDVAAIEGDNSQYPWLNYSTIWPSG